MLEAARGLLNRYKANQFLGFASVRAGCLFGCAFQVATGVILWRTLLYLRPMLEWYSLGLLLYFASGAVLGAYAVFTRSERLTWAYCAHLLSCIVILALLLMDFNGAVHILPKPPTEPSQTVQPLIVSSVEGAVNAVEEAVEKEAESLKIVAKQPHHALLEITTTEAPSAAETHFALNQTEGESEELGKGELPPNFDKLSSEGQNTVLATGKLLKSAWKMVASALLAICTMVLLYCWWFVATFGINKCQSLDELSGQPEQFTVIPNSMIDEPDDLDVAETTRFDATSERRSLIGSRVAV